MTLLEIASDPEIARLIELLYEGYRVPYEEIRKELGITRKKLDSLLDATEELWDTPRPNVYKLTQRGHVAYGIIKSRNIKIKDKRETNEKETSGSFLKSLKEEISRRFL
jgi:hypothetical protein